MKRLALVTGLALLLVGASQAFASTDAGISSGGAKQGQSFAISFKIAKKNGKPTSIKKFNYGQDCKDPDVGPGCQGDDGNNTNNIVMTCQTPSTHSAGTFLNGYLPPMKIKQQKFGGKFFLDTASGSKAADVTVNGELKNHGQKVVGDIRVKGDFDSNNGDCDSTKLDWQKS